MAHISLSSLPSPEVDHIATYVDHEEADNPRQWRVREAGLKGCVRLAYGIRVHPAMSLNAVDFFWGIPRTALRIFETAFHVARGTSGIPGATSITETSRAAGTNISTKSEISRRLP
jgi:hypothetical protein